jgi:hypothetical protein
MIRTELRTGDNMTESYEFSMVNALSEDPCKHIVAFHTDTGRKCRMLDEGLGKLNTRFVRRAAGEGNVIFVAYDPASGLINFATPFNKDYLSFIEVVKEPKPGLNVCLILWPSPLFLPATHPRFEQLSKILYDARENDQVVWVGTFPGDSEILDVRLPDPLLNQK